MSSAGKQAVVGAFDQAHRLYVQKLYKRSLKTALDWYIRRDLWRQKALEIRHRFEQNRDIATPRQVQRVLSETEKELNDWRHPDPYKFPTQAEGSKWERNLPPTYVNGEGQDHH